MVIAPIGTVAGQTSSDTTSVQVVNLDTGNPVAGQTVNLEYSNSSMDYTDIHGTYTTNDSGYVTVEDDLEAQYGSDVELNWRIDSADGQSWVGDEHAEVSPNGHTTVHTYEEPVIDPGDKTVDSVDVDVFPSEYNSTAQVRLLGMDGTDSAVVNENFISNAVDVSSASSDSPYTITFDDANLSDHNILQLERDSWVSIDGYTVNYADGTSNSHQMDKPEPGTVTVSVLNESGSFMEGVEVRAVDPDWDGTSEDGVHETVTTNSEGVAELSLQPAEYRIEVNADNYSVQTHSVTVEEGKTKTVTSNLDPEPDMGTLEVTTTNASSGETINGADIEIINSNGETVTTQSSPTSIDVPVGYYDVLASGVDGYGTASEYDVEVTAGTTTTTTLALPDNQTDGENGIVGDHVLTVDDNKSVKSVTMKAESSGEIVVGIHGKNASSSDSDFLSGFSFTVYTSGDTFEIKNEDTDFDMNNYDEIHIVEEDNHTAEISPSIVYDSQGGGGGGGGDDGGMSNSTVMIIGGAALIAVALLKQG
ncbi:carboxypeptidase regulatory-like domain-containing protein [Haloarchaeobius amylolyticus]|uniref:Carboxypeptidase regulatory-like domain-containing protein n=1 Tax=Haloarchaeobius amylolyticus TaxID=1198296 RepID=A0ABD6BKE7_9EURY